VVPRGSGGRWGSQFELQIGEYYKADLRDHGRLRGIEQKDIYKKRKNLV
jgi:hypothetical protein